MKNANSTTNEMVFLMGTPAAGKSTIGRQMFNETHIFIDCDLFKLQHPDYDPKQPYLVHEWSRQMSDAQFNLALEIGQGQFVVDGTGANAERMADEIKRAQAAGFVTKVVYVKCSLETSLRRSAKRERQVPKSIIIEKAKHIATSFEIVSKYADSVEIVDNDNDR